MTGPAIILDLAGDRLSARPAAFLGPAWFNLYRHACISAGASYQASVRGHAAPLGAAPRLKAALEAARFVVQVTPELAKALAGASNEARKASGGLVARFAVADAALARKGCALAQYQREGASWLAPCDRALLGDEMGLGKTLQALLAAPEDRPILVICPAVAKGVWQRETVTFRPDLTPKILSGLGSAVWPGPRELYALNYELLPATWAELEAAAQAGKTLDHEEAVEAFWRDLPEGATLILDEVHYLKSNKTKRTERARSLIKAVLKRGGRVWGATGTPLLNRPIELWNLLTTLQLHKEAFGSFITFAELFGALKNRWGQYVWPDMKEGHGISPEIARRLQRVMLRRLRKDMMPELPEKIRQDVPIEIPAAARRMADGALEALAARGITIEDAVAAAELGRFNDKDFKELATAREGLARAMIPAALEMAEAYEDSGEPVIVWSDHVAPVEAFRGRPGWGVIGGGMSSSQKTEMENAFQAGKLKGLACSIKAAGTAITLTRAAHELFIDLSYVPGENQQAEDRAVRHGQTRGVVIRRLVPDHVLTKNIMEIITGKMKLVTGTVDAAAVIRPIPRVDVDALEKMAEGGA